MNQLELRYNWFRNYCLQREHSPTLREMGKGLNLSHTRARFILQKFEQLGWVQIIRDEKGRMISRASKPLKQ